MALAAYGKPAFMRELREAVRTTGDGGFTVAPIELDTLAKQRGKHEEWTGEHADLAASVQLRLQEVLLELVRWLHAQTGDRDLTMASGVALNCVANSVLAEEGPFERIWVQLRPPARDAGTALGAALHVAHALGDQVAPMPTAALGRGWTDDWPPGWPAKVAYDARRTWPRRSPRSSRPTGWSPGSRARGRYGPRALGHRSLLANAAGGQPGAAQRRQGPRAVPPGGAHGPGRAGRRALRRSLLAPTCCSPTGCGRPGATASRPWSTSTAAPASRPSTGTPEPLVARLLEAVERRTGSRWWSTPASTPPAGRWSTTARRLGECFGSAPVDVLALGPFLVRRAAFTPAMSFDVVVPT